MAKWSVCTDSSGTKMYINLDNVLYLIRDPGDDLTTVAMVGEQRRRVREEPDSVAIAGVDVGQCESVSVGAPCGRPVSARPWKGPGNGVMSWEPPSKLPPSPPPANGVGLLRPWLSLTLPLLTVRPIARSAK